MALLKLGSLITKMSGKLGGQTITAGAQGTTIKNNGNQRKAPTISQNKQRVNSATVLQHWRTLSTNDKQKYANVAGSYKAVNRVGDSFTYTAFQVFMLLNQNAFRYKGTFLSNPPTPYTFPAPTASLSSPTADIIVGTQSGMDTSDELIIYATAPQSSAFGNPYSKLKEIKLILSTDFGPATDISQDYIDKFGILSSGMNIFFAFKQLAHTNYETSEYFSPQWLTIT